VSVTGSSFSFPARSSGSSYTISATAQPTGPWQTCSVQNGQGTIGGAPVTNVIVSCTTNAYAVSVNVAGLAGGTFQVSDGVDTIGTTPGTTTYTFPTPVASGTSVSVTPVGQPTYPFQTCTAQAPTTATVQGGPVTLNVSCTTNQYPLTVTVTMDAANPCGLTISDGVQSVAVSASAGSIPYYLYEPSGKTFTATWAGNFGTCQCALDQASTNFTSKGTLMSTTFWYSGSGVSLYCGAAIP
jgi:hypothetical protein